MNGDLLCCLPDFDCFDFPAELEQLFLGADAEITPRFGNLDKKDGQKCFLNGMSK